VNLWDAIMSGKPFRRKRWVNVDGDLGFVTGIDWAKTSFAVIAENNPGDLGPNEILADDWEIKEPTIG